MNLKIISRFLSIVAICSAFLPCFNPARAVGPDSKNKISTLRRERIRILRNQSITLSGNEHALIRNCKAFWENAANDLTERKHNFYLWALLTCYFNGRNLNTVKSDCRNRLMEVFHSISAGDQRALNRHLKCVREMKGHRYLDWSMVNTVMPIRYNPRLRSLYELGRYSSLSRELARIN